MTELDLIIRQFEERFCSYKGMRIALYPGEYTEAIVRAFDPGYRFRRILEPGSTEVPEDIDLVILTDRRTGKEPDYNRIRKSCEERDIPLLDLFGLDQIGLHREFRAQGYLTLAQWKQLFSEYDVISLLAPAAAAQYNILQERWVLRRRFRLLHDWLTAEGKTVVFFWDTEEQVLPLIEEGIAGPGDLFQRVGNDQGFLRLSEKFAGKKVIHVGVGTVRDGIIPREYGMDSRLLRSVYNQVSSAPSGRVTPAAVDRKDLLRAIDRHEVISFDIFDTLLKRIVLQPRDVFGLVEEKTGIKGFAENRFQAQNSGPLFTLAEIYEVLKKRSGYDDRTIELLRRTELQTESEILLPRVSMKEIFEYAKSRGKTVVLVSDMYLEEDFLREVLDRNGITGYSRIYISCQFRKLKNEGLFEELSGPGRGGGKILHIGDDYYADYISAQEFGLSAFHVPSCRELAERNGFAEAAALCGTLAERGLLGLGIAAGFDDPFGQDPDLQIAAAILAPLVMGYLQWACAQMAGKGYDLFLLSSRDGWFLRKTYERLRERYPGQLPPGKYFYCNRHAAFLTIMDDPQLSEAFFDQSQFADDPRGLLRQIFGLSEDRLLPYRGEWFREYRQLHEAVIREEARQCREDYREYLDREGITGKRCALMDFVSSGSGQSMLGKKLTVSVEGLYIGVPEYISVRPENVRYYLDHELMDYDTEMKIEVYFTSPEPALDRIGKGGKPVFAEEVRDRATIDRILGVQEKAEACLDLYLDRLYTPGAVIRKEWIYRLCAVINNYDVRNIYYDDMSGKMLVSNT